MLTAAVDDRTKTRIAPPVVARERGDGRIVFSEIVV
jgi:hypothetical protein